MISGHQFGAFLALPPRRTNEGMTALHRDVFWAALAFALSAAPALAQGTVQGAFPPPAPNQNPVCTRLEAQLAAIDRGGGDPARMEMTRRYEDAVAKQQAELDRTLAQSRRLGCEGGGFFSLFSGQNPQCSGINQQIQQQRGNLDRMLAELQRAQGGGGAQEGQRQTVIDALAQANCGPQYRAAAHQQRGFFDSLFGGNRNAPPDQGGFSGAPDGSATFRTVCVRMCDGYYYPVSFSTTPARFHDDEQACRRTCPAAEVMLFSHRNPGEDMTQAVSIDGKPYSTLANAFKYRQEFNPSCSCRQTGQSWADALGSQRDSTVERGDIVVTEERAKVMSAPRDAQGRPIRTPAATQQAAPAVPNPGASAPSDGKKTIRSVGPIFVPAR
jgi:hypothetical protein